MLIAAAVVLAVVLGAATWLLVLRTDGDGQAGQPPAIGANVDEPATEAADGKQDRTSPRPSTQNAGDLTPTSAAPGSEATAGQQFVTVQATPTTVAPVTVTEVVIAEPEPIVESTVVETAGAPATETVGAPETVQAPLSTVAALPPGTGAFSPMTTVTRDNSPMVVTPVTAIRTLTEDVRFTTASGKIVCDMSSASVRCYLDEEGVDYVAPVRPGTCSGHWGGAFVVASGELGRWGCAQTQWSEALAASASILAYGSAFQVGDMTCASQEIGVTCLGPDSHGFRISRADGPTFY